MRPTFFSLALALAAATVPATGAWADGPDSLTPGSPQGAAAVEPAATGFNLHSLFANDPFNPLGWAEPIERSRMSVYVTAEMAQCGVSLFGPTVACPIVILPDGTRQRMLISNRSDDATGLLLVERIEYAASVGRGDAPTIHYVAIEGDGTGR